MSSSVAKAYIIMYGCGWQSVGRTTLKQQDRREANKASSSRSRFDLRLEPTTSNCADAHSFIHLHFLKPKTENPGKYKIFSIGWYIRLFVYHQLSVAVLFVVHRTRGVAGERACLFIRSEHKKGSNPACPPFTTLLTRESVSSDRKGST